MNVKKQALGRGLSALLALPENEEDTIIVLFGAD